MNNSQVAHLWAQRTMERAKGSNFYFEGDTIYSYDAHFPAAKFYDSPDNGRTCVLINSCNYSNTTAKHISLIKNALRPENVFFAVRVPKVEVNSKNDHQINLDYLVNELNTTHEKLKRARNNAPSLWIFFEEMETHLEAYCDFFVLSKPTYQLLSPALLLELKRKSHAQQEKISAKEKLLRERFEKWPFDLSIKGTFSFDDVKLRINGDNVETSKGAFVTIDEAKKAIALWAKKNLVKGERIGNYTVDGLNDDCVFIGCHTISTEEIKRLSVLIHLREKDKKEHD